MAIFMEFWHTSAEQSFVQVLARITGGSGNTPTKPRQGSSSVHPIRQEKTAVSANPFAAWKQPTPYSTRISKRATEWGLKSRLALASRSQLPALDRRIADRLERLIAKSARRTESSVRVVILPVSIEMFKVTSSETVVDRDGRIIFFGVERFISDIANGDCCFICGATRNEVLFNDEHVVPDWILRRFRLHSRHIQIPNKTDFRYGGMTVPCCITCNAKMGDLFEKPMSALFDGGFDAVSEALKSHGPWELFCWMALIFLKAHLKDKYLNYHRDLRKGEMKIAELHSWDDLHHLHCIARAFYTGAEIASQVLGSLAILPAKVRPHFEGFDFIDLSAAQTMLLSIGDVAVIAVFNDSQAALSIASEVDLPKIGGPLSPIQLRELAARFAAINLQVEPRAHFASEFDLRAEKYKITTEHRPDEIHIPTWDNGLFGRIMYALTADFLKTIRNGDEIGELVKSGRYTFLTTPEGKFDVNSMELELDTASYGSQAP
jgi:hypothetical protein